MLNPDGVVFGNFRTSTFPLTQITSETISIDLSTKMTKLYTLKQPLSKLWERIYRTNTDKIS